MKKIYFSLLITFGLAASAFSQVTAPANRIYANSESHSSWGFGGGTVSDKSLAIDDSSSTASTLTLIGSFAYGGYQQTLTFANSVPANTPVHVKIGALVSVLNAGGYTVVDAYDSAGNSIASSNNVTILGILGGENTYENILTASKPIKSIRVRLGSTLGAGIVSKVYGAYYETQGTGTPSNKPFDVLEGTETTSLLNAASVLSSVSNPYNSIDGDTTTAATLYSTANIVAQQQLTALFPGIYPTGSYAHVLIENPGNLLSLSLLNTPLTIQLLNNDSVVQSTATNGWDLIGLELLGSGASAKGWLNIYASAPFNAVKVISNSGLASVISNLKVYEFSVDNFNNVGLPVQYSKDLSAFYSNNKVLLSWTTANEINNKFFDVQRSIDNKTWSSIGKVKTKILNGTGNGTDYSFTDLKPLSGENFYRLVQTDADGKTTIGTVVSVNINATSEDIKLFPNPTSKSITINKEVTSVKIVNVAGSLILTGTTSKLDVSQLPKGIYFISAILKDGTTFKSKFIKE